MKRRNFLSIFPFLALSARPDISHAKGHDDPYSPLKGSSMSDTLAATGTPQKVLVFDVIETLLDLNTLAPRFEKAFGTRQALDEFFAQMLQSAFAITAAGNYTDFGSVAKAALSMVAERRGITLTSDGMMQILSGLRSLPAHPEVATSLRQLKEAGFRMAALTNSALPVLEAQVANAALKEYFDALLTVDTVKRFKPAPEVYHAAAKTLGVTTKDIRMIAAHSWDVGGAMQAGCSAAFVARPGMVLDPLFAKPDIIGKDLQQVADLIILTDQPKSVG